MASPNEPKSKDELEQQLRSMILGNVRIGNDATNPTQKENQPSHRGGSNHGPRGGRSRGQIGPNQSTSYSNQVPHRGRGQPVQVVQRHQNSPGNARSNHPHPQAPQRQHGPPGTGPSKFTPLHRQQPSSPEEFNSQCMFLESVAGSVLPHIEMSPEEVIAKEQFRTKLETICQQALIEQSPEDYPVIGLASFGSLASGFGMPGSDLDLVLRSSRLDVDLRLMEKALLDAGFGVHLLSRTRVPILKVCEKPTPELYAALCAERKKYDDMTPEQREEYDHPKGPQEDVTAALAQSQTDAKDGESDTNNRQEQTMNDTQPTSESNLKTKDKLIPERPSDGATNNNAQSGIPQNDPQSPSSQIVSTTVTSTAEDSHSQPTTPISATKPRPNRTKTWYREKRPSALDFPSHGIGIQSDINSNNPLGLHNTRLLRCYSHSDVRVRLLILFIKAWASRRKINSPRNSTLSSYGYVLMALHFLVNVAQPPVCPNLQLGTASRRFTTQGEFVPCDKTDETQNVQGCDIRFWDDEALLQQLAAAGRLSQNRQPLGVLLRNYFAYYATQSAHTAPLGGFSWTTGVLSLRTPGGVLTKEAKGWTGAKTTVESVGEVRHRYLFAIEDPFELGHNVARTVTHNGIVAIRDEFRRAWRIITAVGSGRRPEGDLFEEVVSMAPAKEEEAAPAEDKDGKDKAEGEVTEIPREEVATMQPSVENQSASSNTAPA